MNSSMDSKDIIFKLNETTVNEFIPLFFILGFLMLMGLIGNSAVLVFIWPKAKQSLPSFFMKILAILDILVCLTISFAIYNYSTIYMFTNNFVCKIYVFSKFFTALFSGFVLLTVAAYRFRKMCCPLKKQLGLKGAKIALSIGSIAVFVISSPQLFLMKTVNMEVPNSYNITVLGSDCVSQTLDNKSLKTFATLLEGFYLFIFLVSSTALIVLYALQGKAVLKMKRNRVKLQPHISFNQSVTETSKSCESRKISENKETIGDSPTVYVSLSTRSKGGSDKTPEIIRNEKDVKQNSSQVSTAKLTIMFSVISLGFILTFLPYVSYAVWRTFHARKSDVLFTTSAINLICLNSYIINSVINPVVYAFFHVTFRQYLVHHLCRWRRV